MRIYPPSRGQAVRVISAKLPREQALAIRAHAATNRLPIQQIIKDAVTNWLAVNPQVNRVQSIPATVPRSIPQAAPGRTDTGFSAPVAELQGIDANRLETRETGPKFKD